MDNEDVAVLDAVAREPDTFMLGIDDGDRPELGERPTLTGVVGIGAVLPDGVYVLAPGGVNGGCSQFSYDGVDEARDSFARLLDQPIKVIVFTPFGEMYPPDGAAGSETE